MDALAGVDLVEELADASVGVVNVAVFSEIDFLILNCPHHSRRTAIVFRFTDRRHANLHMFPLQQERCPKSSEAMVYLAAIGRLLNRLAA